MPNLDYDPQNPSDLLDRPIAEGDMVAWGTTFGRSPAVCVARIERIRFIRKEGGRSYGKNIDCARHEAEAYQLVLRPIKSTGSVTDTEYVPGGFDDPFTGERRYFRELSQAKTKTVHLVKNVVKLEAL